MKKFYSIFLLCALTIPNLVSIEHIFSEKHIICDDIDIHVHQLEMDCSICYFFNTTYDYSFENFDKNYQQLSKIYKLNLVYTKLYTSNFLFYFDSRGPPSNC